MKSNTDGNRIELLHVPYPMVFGLVWLGILGLGMCRIAMAAHAEQDVAARMMPLTRNADGWWSPDHNQATLAVPELDMRTAKFTQLASAGPAPALWSHAATYTATEGMNGSRPLQAGFELGLDTRRQDAYSPTGRQPLSPGSFLSSFKAKYASWKAGFSDSRPSTEVNGVLVYPILEIHYAGWRLPITLYIPPLRGSVSG